MELKRDAHRGVAMWVHKEGRLLGFWGNIPRKEDRWDQHGGSVRATIGGQGGNYVYTNESDQPVAILVNSFQNLAGNATRLKLLHTDKEKGILTYGGGEDTKYNSISLKVSFLSPGKK